MFSGEHSVDVFPLHSYVKGIKIYKVFKKMNFKLNFNFIRSIENTYFEKFTNINADFIICDRQNI